MTPLYFPGDAQLPENSISRPGRLGNLQDLYPIVLVWYFFFF